MSSFSLAKSTPKNAIIQLIIYFWRYGQIGNYSLVIVLFAALLVPLIMARFHISNIPTAVAEIVVGILLGKSLLHWVTVGDALSNLSSLGVIILIFLSGMEIDFNLFKRQPKKADTPVAPLPLAIFSFTSILIVSLAISWGLKVTGLFDDFFLATIIFTTIALGVVIAALKEKELLSRPFGQTILLISVLGEIIPLLALTIYGSINGSSSKSIWLLSLIFLVAIFLLLRFRGVYQLFVQIDKSTTQLDIRLAFFLIITLVAVAEQVGAESILGAFLAGMVMKLLQPREETQDKLTSLGYGFFIPIFFITTGAKLDLPALLADRGSLVLIPLFFIGFILAKAVVPLVLQHRFQMKNALAGAFLTSTTITLVLPAVQVGENLKMISTQQGGAFTLAAILSCLISPILFNKLYQPEAEDLVKTKVTFIGTNIMTVPVAQQLAKGWYEVQMLTDKPENYTTYNSEVSVTLVPDLTEATIEVAGAFASDVLVLGYLEQEINFDLAQMATKHEIPRVIARFERKSITDTNLDILENDGVEIFNTFDMNISMLRAIIESPSTLKILTDTEAGLYEATVHNRRFTGLEVKSLPFIDSITISQIYRNNEFIAPHGDTQIQLHDHLIFTGDKRAVNEIRQQLEKQN